MEETKETEQIYVYHGEACVPADVTHVQVHPSVVEIVAKAFRNCKYLREIYFPEGVKIIGLGAFESCISLQTVQLSSTITEIRDQAFLKCFALQFVGFSENLVLIGDEAFALCESLKSVDIPSTTETIGDNAFMSCEDLVSVGLREGLKRIGEDAFCGCMSLRNIRVPSTVDEIRDGCFSACQSLISVELHWRMRKIHDHAFDGCSKLKNVALASSVEEIGKDAFANCKLLQSQYGESIIEGLASRFESKPIHELCYYQSYFPTQDLMEALKTAFASFDRDGQQLDLSSTDNGTGMTPLAILSMSTFPNFSFAKGLISVHTVEQLTAKDETEHTIADYLCTNDTPTSKKLVIFTVEQIVKKRVNALCLDRWKKQIRDALYKLPSGWNPDVRQKHINEIYTLLNDRELLESV
ncbi:unnamed protein product [Cylindrotheca closterium]|uniref:Leucine-rich repeat domain-containing protein n=1 Tax=Cylindrotheca closterium TaxID=2856 RepID=A0AAD2PV66_9STRA|nr:unnamed protein product [Cylindrotheca closterium]